MKIKTGKNAKTIATYKSNKLGFLTEKLSVFKKQRKFKFPVNHSAFSNTTKSKLKTNSNSTLQAELELQKSRGILYANITRVR